MLGLWEAERTIKTLTNPQDYLFLSQYGGLHFAVLKEKHLDVLGVR